MLRPSNRPGRYPEFFPFGDQQQGVRIDDRFVHVLRIGDFVSDDAAAFVHRYRVVYGDPAAGPEDQVDQHQRRSFADVVRLRLPVRSPPK